VNEFISVKNGLKTILLTFVHTVHTVLWY